MKPLPDFPSLVMCLVTAALLPTSLSQESSSGSLADLEAEVGAMRVKDVVWRKIPWKTCLLEGLAASRKENKPIILWVFIDRPIDDKRC